MSSQFVAYAGQDPTLVSRQNWGYIAYALTAVTGVVRRRARGRRALSCHRKPRRAHTGDAHPPPQIDLPKPATESSLRQPSRVTPTATHQVLLFTLVMLRRVAVAVACIKVASQAVSTMPSILLFPLLPFVLEVGPRLRMHMCCVCV